MERIPDETTIDLREHGCRVARRGSPLSTTCVGSHKKMVTLAQLPPAEGDTWSINSSLRRGLFQLTLDGWENPVHGILDLWLDGKRLCEIDWRAKRTRERSHRIDVSVRWTGVHQLVGRCERSNADADRPTRHWVCLKRVRMLRLGPLS
jgi:hypothetical protein